jgi:aryl-alcohol dehydrogenase-like predicted oxidoreductase
VASIYAEKAARRVDRIRRVMAAADPDWAAEGTLSQKAVRAIRSSPGVSCVLVGMRCEEYVADVLAELRRPIKKDGQFQLQRLYPSAL